MRANLLGTNSLEQSLHIVIVSINKRVGLGVIWVHVASLHVCDTLLVIAFSICLFVLWLDLFLLSLVQSSSAGKIRLLKFVANRNAGSGHGAEIGRAHV